MPGLSAPGEIIVDRWGIPHIYAATQPDAFRLQGFNAARDRLWQIDLWRRRGLGRLSAALGRSYGPPKGVKETRAFFEVASGASFRQVIDVGAWDRSVVMNNPGQSGDPSSPHYRDLIERWAKGRAVPLLFSRAARRGGGGAADRLHAVVRSRAPARRPATPPRSRRA